jgi:hypothetical protein
LGSPARYDPVKWAKPFSELLPLWEELESVLRFAFLAPRWKQRLMAASHPVAYLRSILDLVESDRIKYEEKRDSVVKSRAAVRVRPDSATAAPLREIEVIEELE